MIDFSWVVIFDFDTDYDPNSAPGGGGVTTSRKYLEKMVDLQKIKINCFKSV